MDIEKELDFLEKGLNRYYKEILNYMYFHIRNRHDAESYTKETFFKAFNRTQNVREEVKLRIWIFSIAENLLSERSKKKSTRHNLQDLPESHKRLFGFLDEFEENEQNLLILNEYFGFTQDEVSKMIGMNTDHISSILNKVENRLIEMEEEGYEIFEDYQLIEAHEKKIGHLKKKLIKKAKKKKTLSKGRLSIAAVVIIIFTVGIGISSKYITPNKQVFHHQVPKHDSSIQTLKVKRNDVITKYLTFKGQSKHWEAVNKVFTKDYVFDPEGKYIGNSFRDGYFQINFKGNPKSEKGTYFQVKIDGANGGTNEKGSFPKDGKIQMNQAFAVAKNNKIIISVKWGTHQENLVLTSQPAYYRKKASANVPQLSYLKPVNPKFDFFRSAGSLPFQIRSLSWEENQTGNHLSAYMKAIGFKNSATLRFVVKGDYPAHLIKIFGIHNGNKKRLYQGHAHLPVIQEDGKRIYPATVSFGQTGLWKIMAYSKQKQIGQPIYIYLYDSVRPRNSSLYEQFHKDILTSNDVSLIGDWKKQTSHFYIKEGSRLTIRLKKIKGNVNHIQTFPILIYGIPLSGGKGFVRKYTKSQVQMQGGYYVFHTSLQHGKWDLMVDEGHYPAASFQFSVK